MTRKDIEAVVWKVMGRFDRSEFVAATTDLLAIVEGGRIIESWREPEHITDEELANAARIFTSRVHSMASRTRTILMGDLG